MAGMVMVVVRARINNGMNISKIKLDKALLMQGFIFDKKDEL